MIKRRLQRIKRILLCLALVLTVFIEVQLGSIGALAEGNRNEYRQLKVPVSIEKIGSLFFITDSYHSQVIYSDSLNKPIHQWEIMAAGLNMPHGIASDGVNYVVLDTDNNSVLLCRKSEDGFSKVQVLEGIGIRPHDIYYDQKEDTFYVWSSMTGQMYLLKMTGKSEEARLAVSGILALPEYKGKYVRSFYVMGEYILFPSGVDSNYLLLADRKTLTPIIRFPVTQDIAGMADVMIAGPYFYITVSTDALGNQTKAKIIRTSNLATLAKGKYEDISEQFTGLLVPYYFTQIDGHYYMTATGSKASLYRFDVTNNGLTNIEVVY